MDDRELAAVEIEVNGVDAEETFQASRGGTTSAGGSGHSRDVDHGGHSRSDVVVRGGRAGDEEQGEERQEGAHWASVWVLGAQHR